MHGCTNIRSPNCRGSRRLGTAVAGDTGREAAGMQTPWATVNVALNAKR
jgi:hypothetical protein